MGLIDRAVASALEDFNVLAPVEAPGGERLFDADLEHLAARGVFVPGRSRERQGLELRAIKRRLLRRLGVHRRAGNNGVIARGPARARNIVLVTSSRAGEGKSFIAINLAMSFAFEDRRKVTLVDADTYRPKMRDYLKLPQGPGLSDRIADPTLPMASLTWRDRQAPLTVLTEGSTGGALDVHAAGVSKLFSGLSLRQPDGLVIVDAPPLLATSETFTLARLADEVIFVIEADATPGPTAATALDELLEINPNVSLVLNRCLIPAGGEHYEGYQYYDRSPETADSAETAKGDTR